MRRVVFALVLLLLLSPMMIGAQELASAPAPAAPASEPLLEVVDEAPVAVSDAAPARGPAAALPRRSAAAGPTSGMSVTGQETQFVDRSLTRVRMLLSSSSSYAKLELKGVAIAEHRVLSANPSSAVDVSRDGIRIDGTGSAEILAVLRVPDTASPGIGVKKQSSGSATGTVYRSNLSEALVAQIQNTSSSGTDVFRSVSRATLVGEGLQIPRIDSRRLTLAYYYPWYNKSSFSRGLWWEKPVGPYDTTDPVEVQKIVDQAAANGVDGFIFSWVNGEDSDRRLQYVMAAARNRGNFLVSAAIRLTSHHYGEESKETSKIISSIRAVLRYSNDAAFLKVGGRPVIFMYASRLLTPSQWRAVKSGLASYGLNPFVMGDTAESNMDFDGMYLYNPNTREADGLARKYRKVMERLRIPWALDSSYRRRLWAATVSPGLDDSMQNPANPRRRSRENGARFDATWRAALGSMPEWILVTSYNEWYEATHISPGTKTGYKALQQTRSWSSTFANS